MDIKTKTEGAFSTANIIEFQSAGAGSGSYNSVYKCTSFGLFSARLHCEHEVVFL